MERSIGSTILEVLNCGFHKTKSEKQDINRKRKETTAATVQYKI
jgi:hypothetical protein